MENSIFFNHVLRGLGFQVYTAGAKIRHRVGGVPEGDYIGWVHLVNVVVLKEKDPKTGEIVKRKYALDVSFGGDGPRCPLPMAVDGPGHSTAITKNIGTQELRLIHDFIPSQIHRSEEDCAQKMWIYQYRNRPELPWNSFYAFPEFEFTEQDFHVMNWYTGSHPESFQTFTVLVVRFLKKPAEPDAEIGEKRGEICGKVMMVNGEVKQNLGGRTEIIKTCKNEEERVAALKEYFDIKLAQEEIDSIKGRVTELREAALTA
ncbi:putative tpa: arylamine n-acetyltransferase 2 [Phaeomoniella chlamydospora]|uniref:Putative tpa: arylamine n-acetyltransferase 2 n=1 Tax=Phaeomoniella chlamydospora TaxID=158046 RepID=A0A0G2DUE2_PHACM|nr:putative tpa: arylamine n-acetyltransferase 2 [Phaeomoniella chlamydospora]